MLPAELLEAWPVQASLLRRLDALEGAFDEASRRSEVRKSVRRTQHAGHGPSAAGTLRVYVDHSKQRRDNELYWELSIEGRLLDDGVDEPSDELLSKVDRLSRRPNFGGLVERAEISFDRKKAAITWSPGPNGADGLVVRRLASNKPTHVRVSLSLKYFPKRYKMSAALQKVIKGYRDDMTRDAVITAVSRYADRRGLRQPHDRRIVACDADLRACFGVDSFAFSQLDVLLAPHLDEPDAVVIDYTIPPGDAASSLKFVDCLVDVPLPQDDLRIFKTTEAAPPQKRSRTNDLDLVCLDACARAARLPPPGLPNNVELTNTPAPVPLRKPRSFLNDALLAGAPPSSAS